MTGQVGIADARRFLGPNAAFRKRGLGQADHQAPQRVPHRRTSTILTRERRETGREPGLLANAYQTAGQRPVANYTTCGDNLLLWFSKARVASGKLAQGADR